MLSRNDSSFHFIGLENAGQNCYQRCNGQQGKCGWCGLIGYCCRKGWAPGNGCDGSFGGDEKHVCALKPTSKFNIFLSETVENLYIHLFRRFSKCWARLLDKL